MSYTTISLDLETLDVTPSAVVLSIGAAAFNLDDIEDSSAFTLDRTFYAQLKLQSQINNQRTISADTLMWWLNQSKAAQAGISDTHKQQPVDSALLGFNEFVKITEASYLLGNGNMFDNAILHSLYDDENFTFPFKYWADVDLRTMKLLARDNNPIKREGVHHNALDDAIFQALSAQQYYRSLYCSE